MRGGRVYRDRRRILCSNGGHAEKYVWDMAGQIDNIPAIIPFYFLRSDKIT
jgi:hypothetical protein